jgi:hypothetical protein
MNRALKMLNVFSVLMGFLTFFFGRALPVCAQSVYTVDRLTDTGEGSGLSGDLRYCVTNATSGLDTIIVSVTGTINLTGPLPDLATSVTIAGPGADQLTVRRTTGGSYRILTLTRSATVLISGLTLANGKAPEGGGIFVGDGNLTLTNSILYENMGGIFGVGGGAIYLERGNVSVDKSTILTNFGYARGGAGIYVAAGSLSLTNSVLFDNRAADSGGGVGGGGIYVAGGKVAIDYTALSSNSASGYFDGAAPSLGGGIYVAGGTVSIDHTTLSNNFAVGGNGADENECEFVCYGGGPGGPGRGGAIYEAEGSVSVNNSTLSNNHAVGGSGGNSIGAFGGVGGPGEGGSIYVAGGTLQVFQNTLSGNGSGGGTGGEGWCDDCGGTGGNGLGGSLTIFGGSVEVQHSTLTLNQSTGGAPGSGARAGQGTGGGLALTRGTLRARNTILAGNTATTTAPDVSGNLNSSGHNLIGNSTGGSGYDSTDLLDVDPLLGPLQNNGGPTFTHALLFGSPAIDAGDNTDAPELDQRGPGFPRIVNGIIDIGAFEFQAGITRSWPGCFLWDQ